MQSDHGFSSIGRSRGGFGVVDSEAEAVDSTAVAAVVDPRWWWRPEVNMTTKILTTTIFACRYRRRCGATPAAGATRQASGAGG